jgi:hypothetical protein
MKDNFIICIIFNCVYYEIVTVEDNIALMNVVF